MALGLSRWRTKPTRVLTLLHVSDLHFGYPSAEEGALPPLDWKRHVSVFDGFLGHHTDALHHLSRFAKVLTAQEGQPPVLVVTGDLTACGRAEEFKRALTFLESSYDLGGTIVGLADAHVRSRCIPGNHDQWPGTGSVVGPRTETVRTLFKTMPMPLFEKALPRGRVFQLFGIDSDADVSDTGVDRRLARGHFVSQLKALELDSRVSPPTGNEIRALLVHHSPSHSSLKAGALAVGKPSRRALDDWIARAGVSIVLTGHIHRAWGAITRVSDRGTSWDVMEARCGTTTQLDRIPVTWAAAGTFRGRRLALNSLIVHRLLDYGTELTWEAEYVQRGNKGFEPVGSLPGVRHSSVVVWPRH